MSTHRGSSVVDALENPNQSWVVGASRRRPVSGRGRVARGGGVGAVAIESLERRAMFSVSPDPGATYATAYNVGGLNGNVTLTDEVSNADVRDVYQFSMPRDGQFFGRLRVEANAADITLVKQAFDPKDGH